MTAAELAAVLPKTALFEGLETEEVRTILQTYYFPISRYEEGRRVAFRGDPYEELCIILKGSLQAEINDIEGHTLTVETLAAPQVVASAVFFSSARRLPVDLVAKTAVTLLRIPRPEVLRLLREHEAMLQALLTDMGDRLQFLAQRLRMNQFGSIRQKLAVYLLDHVQGHRRGTGAQRLRIPNTRQELADIFGVARPSVSRVIAELEEEGLIRSDGKDFEILDKAALEALAEDIGPED